MVEAVMAAPDITHTCGAGRAGEDPAAAHPARKTVSRIMIWEQKRRGMVSCLPGAFPASQPPAHAECQEGEKKRADQGEPG